MWSCREAERTNYDDVSSRNSLMPSCWNGREDDFLGLPSFDDSTRWMSFNFARKIAKSDYYDIPVSLSVCESAWRNLGWHWKDFHQILSLSIFRKYVDKIKVSLKPDKNIFVLLTVHLSIILDNDQLGSRLLYFCILVL